MTCKHYEPGAGRQGRCSYPAALFVRGELLDKSKVRLAHCLMGCPVYDGPPRTPEAIMRQLQGEQAARDTVSMLAVCKTCPAYTEARGLVVICSKGLACCGVSLTPGACPAGKW